MLIVNRRSVPVSILLLMVLVAPVWAQEKGWEKEWNEILRAAKKEGRVIIQGSPDPVMRKEVIPKFTARFGIPVEFLAGRSSHMAAKVRTERRAGIYTMDVFMSGIGTASRILYPEKLINPLKTLLILPEVVDPSKWKKGKPWFVDPEEKYVLRLFHNVAGSFFINTDYVKPEEVRSAKDFLNPKWKGKISTEDPTVRGSGRNQAARYLLQFGREYLKRLYIDQKPARTRNRRQMADWLARGTYPICLNCRGDDVKVLQKEGFKVLEIFGLSDMPAAVNGSPFHLMVASNPPHPNAAQVFVNWITSKEGMEIYSWGRDSVSLRTDVDESVLPPGTIPRPGVKYFDNHDWNWVATGRRKSGEQAEKLIRSWMKKR